MESEMANHLGPGDDSELQEGALELTEMAPEAGEFPLEELIEELEETDQSVAVRAVGGGLRAGVIAELSSRLERPVVVVAERTEQAERIVRDLTLFADAGDESDSAAWRSRAVWYPGYDVGPFHRATGDRKIRLKRLAALHEVSEETPPRFTVTSVGALMRKTLPREAFDRHRRRFGIGDVLDNDELRRITDDCGYTEASVVEDPGTYAVRGDVVDIYPPHEEYPIRMERWGDEIAEMRRFNPETQRSVEECQECVLYPVREAILDEESVQRAIGRLRELNSEMERPFGELRETISDLKAGLHIVGIEALLPALHGEMEDFLAYLPDEALTVVVEPEAIVDRAATTWDKRSREWEEVRDDGEYVFDFQEYYRQPEATKQQLVDEGDVEWRRIQMLEEDQEARWETSGEPVEFRVRENTDVVQIQRHNQGLERTVKAFSERIDEWVDRYGTLAVVCRTAAQADRLVELLEGFDTPAIRREGPLDLEAAEAPVEQVEVYQGRLSSGFRSEPRGVALVSGLELFGKQVRTGGDKSLAEQAEITHFKDLTVGDLVVHVEFGIARYQGIEHLEVEGIANDFLRLEYADDDRLYLPVHRLGRVQKYIGDSERVAVDKMGGKRWANTKEKVKKNIRELAGDLLSLYAKREMANGIAYSEPGEFYREFEEAFPYEETPDQAQAIEDVLDDMTQSRPMDRLICGDVGFGKTEVAMRAAMKAIIDGKQVAVLVPTTLLCEQHLITFSDRMEEFGVRVEAVSRFRSGADTREILEDNAEGKVDVLIGTHRLLSSDVDFDELGLLVVDEEQRFGVKAKERIKRMKSEIDVLTLTATPIPRTLQMSLLGIRDLSVIATPPHNRLAVRTHVAKFSDGIIREAVMRELSRGGQVFFVHNRVSTINELAEHLRSVVPEARIGIGHGQMKESELEEVMYDYIHGEINVLLCTSIVESGLDIPNANTMIINRADMFGLSQLYQLRGRVGRDDTRAYCYLLVPARRDLPPDAEKRLEVMQRFTDLGSGFHVARYDLEIRGAGNLLSEDQSGHVEKVGLDMYTELLEEAINDLRDEDVEDDIEPEVNIPVETHIPERYIPATSLRLTFYKRFSLARSHDELEGIFQEMMDRFGEPPKVVRNLRRLIAIKVDLRRLRAGRLDAGMSAISIELDRSTPLEPGRVVEMVNASGGKWQLTKEMKLIYNLNPEESSNPLETSRAMLDKLLSL